MNHKDKYLLFLISVGKDYHTGNALSATVNLFEKIIKGLASLKEAIDDNPQALDAQKKVAERARGKWRIMVAIADTLQAYNGEGSKEEWAEKGEAWRKEAEASFEKLVTAGGGVINVQVECKHWEDLLQTASERYQFNRLYDQLVAIYTQPGLSKENQAFCKAVDSKRKSYAERQHKSKPPSTLSLTAETHPATKQVTVTPNPSSADRLAITRRERETKLIGDSDPEEARLLPNRTLIHRLCYGVEAAYARAAFSLGKQLAAQGRVTYQLPSFNQNYAVRRQELMAELTDYFQTELNTAGETLIVSIHGMGGLGKSHLAADYSLSTDKPYRLKAWLRADDIIGGFKGLGYGLGLFVDEDRVNDQAIPAKTICKKVKDWLTENPRWLLIIDNVEDYEALEKYIPETGGHMLLTSRKTPPAKLNVTSRKTPPAKLNAGVVKALPIPTMTEEESIELLTKISGREDEDFVKLAKRLGHMTLALEQVGAYLRNNQNKTVAQYLTDYDQINQDILKNPEFIDKSLAENPVARTFTISFNNILNNLLKDKKLKNKNQEKGKEYRTEIQAKLQALLRVCAYLDTHDIPRALLKRWWQAHYSATQPDTINADLLEELLNQLEIYGLIKSNKENHTISLHSILQEVILSFPYFCNL